MLTKLLIAELILLKTLMLKMKIGRTSQDQVEEENDLLKIKLNSYE
jgi:hypothetical protein